MLCEAAFSSSSVRFKPVLVNGNTEPLAVDMECAAGRAAEQFDKDHEEQRG